MKLSGEKYIKFVFTLCYNIIIGISPRIEVFFRKLYWNNISKTSQFRVNHNSIRKDLNPIKFQNILDNLSKRGIVKGSIIIVHSSYDLLENSKLPPEEINSMLLELIGTEGTLVMPAIRRYKEDPKVNEYLLKNMSQISCTYNVQKSKVISGFLPYMLMQRADCFISRFPLNPVVAIGKHAKKMIEKNLEGVKPSPHGPNSSWKYCVDNNAIVIGLGVNMPHFLTITHVNEECSLDWPIKNWYRKRNFEIIDKDFKIQKEVLERRPLWGAIYFAESKYRKDLIRNNIIEIEKVEGLDISIIHSNRLMDFLKDRSNKGYPYYVGSKFLKKKGER
jgi:aminoglycoside 3-N-acetyltransferase